MVAIASIIIAIITLVKSRGFAAAPNVASFKGLNGLKITNIVFVPINALAFIWSGLILISTVFAVSTVGSYSGYYSYSISYDDRMAITFLFIFGIVGTSLSLIALILSIVALAKSSGLVGRYKSQMTPPVVAQTYVYQQPAYQPQPQPVYQQAPAAQPATYCTSCGTPNAVGATYCISCGSALDKR